MTDQFMLAEWLKQLAARLEMLGSRGPDGGDVNLLRLAEEAREWAEDLEAERWQ